MVTTSLLSRVLDTAGVRREPPQWLVLEATNHCNRACPICGAAQILDRQQRGFLAWEMFQGLADEAEALRPKMVCLHAHGESLLHPEIVPMVAALASRGLRTQIVSNGDPLTVEMSRQLRDAGLSELVVSHPGVSADNYRACRGAEPSSLEDERLGRAFAPWAGSGRSTAVRAQVLPALVAGGGRTIAGFLANWLTRPGVERVELGVYQPWPQHVREDLLQILHRKPQRCRLVSDGLTVLWNGTITPCSYDVEGELALGRWPEVSLAEAYHSSALRGLRWRSLVGGKLRPRLCRNCLVVRSPAPAAVVRARDLPVGGGAEVDRWLAEVGEQSWSKLTMAMGREMAPGGNGCESAATSTPRRGVEPGGERRTEGNPC